MTEDHQGALRPSRMGPPCCRAQGWTREELFPLPVHLPEPRDRLLEWAAHVPRQPVHSWDQGHSFAMPGTPDLMQEASQ